MCNHAGGGVAVCINYIDVSTMFIRNIVVSLSSSRACLAYKCTPLSTQEVQVQQQSFKTLRSSSFVELCSALVKEMQIHADSCNCDSNLLAM